MGIIIMKKLLIIPLFIFLLLIGSILTANIDLYYFDYITRSENYTIYSNVSDTFNFYIGVAAEDMLKRLYDTFLYNRSEEEIKKDIILVFENEDELQDFIPSVDRITIESLMEDSITKDFNPAPNNVYGFNTELRKFTEPENIVFFVPNINIEPYEEIYNYSPLFQALTEQFFKTYLTTNLPEWMIKGILYSVADYKKEFKFSLIYRIEKYYCAAFERKFWSDVVMVNRYWSRDKFTLNQVLDNDTSLDKESMLYKSYISLLSHYFFFNPFDRRTSSKNLVRRIDEHLSEYNELDNSTLKSFITEEYGIDLNQLEKDIYKFYSSESGKRAIRQFWDVYDTFYKSNKNSDDIIYMTSQTSYPDQNIPTPLRNIIDGDMEGYYQTDNPLMKGESIIIDTNANLMTRTILIQFANFAVTNNNEGFNRQIPEKARVISSYDGKNWSVWEYINSDTPIVYLTETDYNALRYWGIVVDNDMITPLTIDEMWIK